MAEAEHAPLLKVRSSLQRLTHKPPMPTQDKFTVDPISKWKRYRRFPCKLTLSLVLSLLLFLETLMYSVGHNTLEMNLSQALRWHFLPENQADGVAKLPNVPAILPLLRTTVTRYHKLNETIPGVFRTDLPITMTVTNDDVPSTERTAPISCPLTLEHPLGPFEPENPECPFYADLASNVTEISLALEIVMTPSWSILESAYGSIMEWHVVQQYRLSHSTGLTTVGLLYTYTDRRALPASHVPQTSLFWFTLAILFLCVWEMALRFRKVLKWWKMSDFEKQEVVDLPVWSKSWSIFTFISDTFTTLSSIFCLVYLLSSDSSVLAHLRWLFLGTACLTQWIKLLSFLELSPRFSLLLRTVRTAAPQLLAFAAVTAPILMAFILFGTVVFGRYCPYFRTVGRTSVSLFAVLNGDSIVDMFAAVHDANTPFVAFIGRVYVFCFVCFFIYVIINLFRVSVVRAYESVREYYPVHLAPENANPMGEDLLVINPPSAQLRLQSSPTPPPAVEQEEEEVVSALDATLWEKVQDHFAAFKRNATTWNNVLLCLLVTVHALTIVDTHNEISQDTVNVMKELFLPPDPVDDLNTFQSRLYATQDVADWVNSTVQKYFTFNATHPGMYWFHHVHGTTEPLAPLMTVAFLESGSFWNIDPTVRRDDRFRSITCNLTTAAPLGPFGYVAADAPGNCSGIPDLFGRVTRVNVDFSFTTQHPGYFAHVGCMNWRLTQQYDFAPRDGFVHVELSFSNNVCSRLTLDEAVQEWTFFETLGVLVCAFVGILLSVHQVRLYGCAGLRSPLRLFAMLTDVVNVVWAAVHLNYMLMPEPESIVVVDAHWILIGTGCMMSWFVLFTHVDTIDKFHVLGASLQAGISTALSWLLGALPVFLGYSLFGTTVYGHRSYKFSSVVQTCVTLFGLINGDAVFSVFEELNDPTAQFATFISRIYLMSFVALFISAIVNIFLVIMEHAYSKAVHSFTGIAAPVSESGTARRRAPSTNSDTSDGSAPQFASAVVRINSPIPSGSPGTLNSRGHSYGGLASSPKHVT
eukprot:TRINITY_DN16507_c0_g1_i1.p1 TRINITY_DN16507_c0_g1~~TRINITY_DN16507_c0_g1_i1.p1  ORF type:complete len:1052 (+),score=162.23 TRINITY_DN16507_c0_g1_i1:50-3157(+)